jgi:hypothetical protein
MLRQSAARGSHATGNPAVRANGEEEGMTATPVTYERPLHEQAARLETPIRRGGLKSFDQTDVLTTMRATAPRTYRQ